MAADHRQKGPALGSRAGTCDSVSPGFVARRGAPVIAVLILAAALTAASWAAVHIYRQSSICSAQTERLGSGLNLTNLALVPAGRVLRHPAAAHRGIDLRYGPLLPPIQTDPATLIVTSGKVVAP